MTDRTRDYFIQSITPPPQKIDVQDGAYYELCNGAKLLFNAPADAADILRADAFLYWKIEFDVTCGNADPAVPAEGYQLTVTADSIMLQASDAAGVRNALRTLRQLAQPERGVRIISKHILPQCRIEDAPALSFRGMHICWFPETEATHIEKMIRMAGYYKYNYIVLEPWGVFPFECEPDFCWKDKAVPRAVFKKMINLAKSLGITVIPQLNLNGHASLSRGGSGKHFVLDQHPEYAPLFEPGGWCWCLSNPETRKLLTAMVEELHEFFGNPPYFHAGCDEAHDMVTCAECAEHLPADLLQDHLVYFNDLFRKRGARMMIWHDMLLDHAEKRWEGYVVCGNQKTGTTEMYKTLPKDILICDWEYCNCVPPRDQDFEWESTRFFMDAGFDTLLCPWQVAVNCVSQGRYIWKNNGFGLLGTSWHTCFASDFQSIFLATAVGAWNPAAGIQGMNKLHGWNRHIRAVEQDMNLEQYEDFGYNTQYQISPERFQGMVQ